MAQNQGRKKVDLTKVLNFQVGLNSVPSLPIGSNLSIQPLTNESMSLSGFEGFEQTRENANGGASIDLFDFVLIGLCLIRGECRWDEARE